MSRSNYDKPFYVDVGTSVAAIRCSSNGDVIDSMDHNGKEYAIKIVMRTCDRMNKEAKQFYAPTGNAAAMREALELAIEVGDWCCANTDDPLECCEYSCAYQVEPHGEASEDCPWKKIRAALSAPARNCDRFKSVKEAAIEFSKRRDNPQPCPDFTFSEWLFEQAEERKGEVNGRK